jgi:hypothetical protein
MGSVLILLAIVLLFTDAVESYRKVTYIPYFPMSKESDPREGFIERP